MESLASCNAASAEDTFGGISDNGRRKLVNGGGSFFASEAALTGICDVCGVQKLAAAVFGALLAVLVVV